MEISVVEPAAIQHATTLFAENVYGGDVAEAREHLDGHEDGSSFSFIATVDNILAGYITVRWESHNEHFRANGIPFIHHLEVFPQFKGHGIASALMDSAEKTIAQRSDYAGICVGIFDAYGPAQKLYSKRGYILDGRGVCHHHRPIQIGEKLVVDHDLLLWMTKKLT